MIKTYYHNHIVTAPAYGHSDAWDQMQQRGQHVILHHSEMPLEHIQRVLTLASACERANGWLCADQLFEPGPHANEVANLVRINLCYHSLVRLGNVKPMLLQYLGSMPLQAATGGTRMAALELIPECRSVGAFVSTHHRWAEQWRHLEQVTSWDRFCELAAADPDSMVSVRMTDAEADYGLDWYEVSVGQVAVPGDDLCLRALECYLDQQPRDFRFSPDWFTQTIAWQC